MNEAIARGGAPSQCRPRRRPARQRAPDLASVPARLHPAEPAWSGRPWPIPIARLPICCSSRPAVARRRPISVSRHSPSRFAADARRLLGAGVTVIMRYTLRLLTLDQLSRAAGVICALELAREASPRGRPPPAGRLADRDRPLGRLGRLAQPAGRQGRYGRRHGGDARCANSGQGRERRRRSRLAPGAARLSRRDCFHCMPNVVSAAPTSSCAAPTPLATSAQPPASVLTVDEAIYRRLPAFLIATVDKFASLPWVGEAGAFFGHVDRFDDGRLLRCGRAGRGQKLFNDQCSIRPT